MGQKDKVIASDASAALRRLLVDYQSRKDTLEPEWFAIGAPLQADPDFVALTDDSLEELARNRTWLEWKGLRQVREVFSAALSSLPEMAHVVAIDTRYVGEAALAAGNRDVFAMIVKFMNTYLRAALNAHDVRTAYNVLNQYRQLAEALLAAPEDVDRWSSTTLVEVAAHFKYYARLAHGNGMGFVTETAAYDLCALCEVASVHQSDCQDRLLQIFLQIDDAPGDARRRARAARRSQGAGQAGLVLPVDGRVRRGRRPSSTTWPPNRRSACVRFATRCWPSPPRISGRSSTAARTSTTCPSRARNACGNSSRNFRRWRRTTDQART